MAAECPCVGWVGACFAGGLLRRSGARGGVVALLGGGVVCVWVWCGIVVAGLVLFVVMLLLRLGVLWVVYLSVVCQVVILCLALDVVVVLVNGLGMGVLIWLVWMWESCVRVGGMWIM